MSNNQSAQTSGSDIKKASATFTDGAEKIQEQVEKVAESQVTAKDAGRHFQQAGDSYQKLLDKLENNVKAFGETGKKISRSLDSSAKEYQSSDERGAEAIGKVKA